MLPPYEALLSLLFEYGDDLPLPDSRPSELRAFDVHEEAKARSMADDLVRMPLAKPSQVPQRLWDAEQEPLHTQRQLAGGVAP
ncbi:hypothetical protein ACIQUY_26475 [Streptomyces sp. NPDC090231]|uniref:hypothetical protein n=1 Tax=unclassified Streptomyces TaxID=2593676 RepID=UPI003815601C